MPTAYTSNRKIGALDLATTPLAATNELVINQNGDILKTPLSAIEAKVFDAKTATSSPTGTEVVVIRQTDNSLRQVALSNIVPAGNITNAKVSDSAAIADTKLATISTAGKVANSATTATSSNTINAIVARDGSGNFSATGITATTFTGTLAGNITGNAATATTATTATTLATGRTIALTGDVTGTTGSFNGSANVSAATTIANNAVTTAKIADANVTTAKIADANVTTAKIADSNVTTAKIADSNVTNAKLAAGIDAGKLTTGTLPVARIADGDIVNAKLATDLDASKLTAGTLPIARIADGAVTNAKLATGIDASKLTTGTLPADRIGSGAITTARIADDAVTNDKLSLAANAGEIKKALNADNAPPIFACRAWVNFDGTRNEADTGASTNGNNVKIRANGNVASVRKDTTGNYTVTLSTAMPDANYAMVAMVWNQGRNAANQAMIYERSTDLERTTSSFRISAVSGNNAVYSDFEGGYVAIFR
jgi:hypothetical protein